MGKVVKIMVAVFGISLLSALSGCTITNENSPDIVQEEFASETQNKIYETQEIYVDRDGMKIYGVAHIPSSIKGKMPVVILSHELGATLNRVKNYGESLAKEGYITVCFDFCGGGYGNRSDGELLDMSVLTEKADLEAILNEVKQWDFVDTNSIYLMGNSQGGLVTSLVAAQHRDEIRAVILIYPAFCIYDDVHEMFDSTEEIPQTHNLLGLRLGRRYFTDIWDQEPYGKIKEYGKNILLIHGDKDSIVPISYSERLSETVDHVEYHVIKGADHGYIGEDFDLAVSYIKDFLNKNQKDDKGGTTE